MDKAEAVSQKKTVNEEQISEAYIREREESKYKQPMPE